MWLYSPRSEFPFCIVKRFDSFDNFTSVASTLVMKHVLCLKEKHKFVQLFSIPQQNGQAYSLRVWEKYAYINEIPPIELQNLN